MVLGQTPVMTVWDWGEIERSGGDGGLLGFLTAVDDVL
jgi:hypothetical protein